MSYTKLLYHIVFSTKYRRATIPDDQSEKLYRYIWGFVKNQKSILYRVNGAPDHLHLFVELHSTVAVADFVRRLKNATHKWLDENKEDFPDFEAWGKKYCALTYCERDKAMIVNYIKNQREHHRVKTASEELRDLLAEHSIWFDERYFDED